MDKRIVYEAVRNKPVVELASKVETAVYERCDELKYYSDAGENDLVIPYGAQTVSRDILSPTPGREWKTTHYDSGIPYSVLTEESRTRLGPVSNVPDFLEIYGLNSDATVKEYYNADKEMGEFLLDGLTWTIFQLGVPSSSIL